MDIALKFLELLGPTLVGILTVPLFAQLKKLVAVIDKMAPWIQQILVIILAAALSYLGALTNTVLPESLSLFVEADIAALLSGVLAIAVHAGDKARTNGGG